jgi:hypothetical protein
MVVNKNKLFLLSFLPIVVTASSITHNTSDLPSAVPATNNLSLPVPPSISTKLLMTVIVKSEEEQNAMGS